MTRELQDVGWQKVEGGSSCGPRSAFHEAGAGRGLLSKKLSSARPRSRVEAIKEDS